MLRGLLKNLFLGSFTAWKFPFQLNNTAICSFILYIVYIFFLLYCFAGFAHHLVGMHSHLHAPDWRAHMALGGRPAAFTAAPFFGHHAAAFPTASGLRGLSG